MSDVVRERILKVFRLADQGIGGEKVNAEAMLEKLLKKHNMTHADLESGAAERSMVWFLYTDDLERELIMGVIDCTCGKDTPCYKRGKEHTIGAQLTASEKVGVDVLLDVYVAKWRGALLEVTVAFIGKHRLFAPLTDDEAEASPTPPDPERSKRIRGMSDYLEDVDRPRQRLGSGLPGSVPK